MLLLSLARDSRSIGAVGGPLGPYGPCDPWPPGFKGRRGICPATRGRGSLGVKKPGVGRGQDCQVVRGLASSPVQPGAYLLVCIKYISI